MTNSNQQPDKSTETGDNDADESRWAEDQQQRDYYYDDSHGYEIYKPDEDDEETDKDIYPRNITKKHETA